MVLLFFLFFLSSPTNGQQSWNYSTITEAHLDDAYLIEPPHALKEQLEKKIASFLKMMQKPLPLIQEW